MIHTVKYSLHVQVKFLLNYAAILTLITLLFVSLDIEEYGEIVGFCSLSIEATLGFPQMISNYRTKSVEGLSYAMIGSWLIGDAFKTTYFILEVITYHIKEPTFPICHVRLDSVNGRLHHHRANLLLQIRK